MALFGIGKKKHSEEATVSSDVQILGSGCAACNTLEANVVTALSSLGQDTAVEHVTDFTKIAMMGVMTTPALVVDGKVLSSGVVLDVEQAKDLIKKARNI